MNEKMAREALEWYGEKAEALVKYMASGNMDALEAIAVEMALDGGDRAKKAFCADLSDAKEVNPYLCTPLMMLLDQPGLIRAYKIVNENDEGIFYGGIKYNNGEVVSVDNVNTDTGDQCGAGISIATLSWCMNQWKKHRLWRKGYRILIVEHTAKDIAAIPVATDGKYRVRRCKVVGEKSLEDIGLIGKERRPEPPPDDFNDEIPF